MAEKLFKKREVCERLQFSMPKLNRLIDSGRLPVLRAGPHVRITESALRAYLTGLLQDTGAEGQR